MTIAGVLIRNTEPHQKCSSRIPDRTGPIATPPVSTADQIAIAVPRCECRGADHQQPAPTDPDRRASPS
jgi:hypothetical protein